MFLYALPSGPHTGSFFNVTHEVSCVHLYLSGRVGGATPLSQLASLWPKTLAAFLSVFVNWDQNLFLAAGCCFFLLSQFVWFQPNTTSASRSASDICRHFLELAVGDAVSHITAL
jgi:hypothetical protein